MPQHRSHNNSKIVHPWLTLPCLLVTRRPAQPLTFGCLQLAAVFVLTYFGAFCGVLLGSSYLEEVDAQWKVGGVLIRLAFLLL